MRLVEGVVLKENLISLEIWDFDVILGMDCSSTHHASMDHFIKKVVFRKSRFLKLEFEGNSIILPTCVISAFKTKRLLHKDCKAYLAYVIDTSTLKVTSESVSVVQEFSNVFPEDLPGLPPNRELEFGIDILPGSVPFLHHCIEWSQLS